jgi:hypothetical protein
MTRSKSATWPAREEIAQRLLQVGAHRAADAAVGHQGDVFRSHRHDVVVDADLADFVDHDRCAVHARMAQQFRDERRLAGAEEAGDQRDGQLARQGIARHRCGALRCPAPARTARR